MWEMVANYKPMDKIRTNEMVLIMNESTNERGNGTLSYRIMLPNKYWRNDRIINKSLHCKHHN